MMDREKLAEEYAKATCVYCSSTGDYCECDRLEQAFLAGFAAGEQAGLEMAAQEMEKGGSTYSGWARDVIKVEHAATAIRALKQGKAGG